jgi:very-short-patch-repair endonuclease
LRKRSTDAENQFWLHLKGKNLEGVKFRRQAPIGDYIVDFVAFEKRLIIEVDGGQHADEE